MKSSNHKVAMAKKTRADEIDSSFIINAFRKDDRSIPPSARIISGNPDDAQREGPEAPDIVGKAVKEPVREEVERRRKVTKPDYESTFVRETSITARQGKQVYIRKEYHDRIQKIIHVVGQNELSIASYLDNVLAHHFSMFAQEINETFNDHLKSFGL